MSWCSRPSRNWHVRMIERAVQADVPFAWVAGDEVYGGSPKLREWVLRLHDQGAAGDGAWSFRRPRRE